MPYIRRIQFIVQEHFGILPCKGVAASYDPNTIVKIGATINITGEAAHEKRESVSR
jgi:hypothetical protein